VDMAGSSAETARRNNVDRTPEVTSDEGQWPEKVCGFGDYQALTWKDPLRLR